ncbi:hypothetical protein LINPERPRIM_LOCUS1967 [Linum perenne]
MLSAHHLIINVDKVTTTVHVDETVREKNKKKKKTRGSVPLGLDEAIQHVLTLGDMPLKEVSLKRQLMVDALSRARLPD